ncbi:MAG: heavy-metal-associated domain-containing protein [Phycisphaerales bacterium]|nr:heavy-metal-associated domain-containing protein [Phycisphaerales bacterium]
MKAILLNVVSLTIMSATLGSCERESPVQSAVPQTDSSALGATDVNAVPQPSANEMTSVIFIAGMHCSGCVDAITAKVMGIKGVSRCQVSLEQSQATVRSSSTLPAGAIEDAISRLGYKPTLVSSRASE